MLLYIYLYSLCYSFYLLFTKDIFAVTGIYCEGDLFWLSLQAVYFYCSLKKKHLHPNLTKKST